MSGGGIVYLRMRDVALERDALRLERLTREGPPRVGHVFSKWINQADRECWVVAVRGKRYAYAYQMQDGEPILRIADSTTGRERTVTARKAPKWVCDAIGVEW